MLEGWDCCHGSAENPEKLNKTKNQIIRYNFFVEKHTYILLYIRFRVLALMKNINDNALALMFKMVNE